MKKLVHTCDACGQDVILSNVLLGHFDNRLAFLQEFAYDLKTGDSFPPGAEVSSSDGDTVRHLKMKSVDLCNACYQRVTEPCQGIIYAIQREQEA